jgi:Na+-driven multidrug efflux pump
MFQAMGNTIPSLVASASRIVVIAIPAVMMAGWPGFELRWIWYLSVAAVYLQLAVVFSLLRREFRVRLDTMPGPAVPSQAPAAG